MKLAVAIPATFYHQSESLAKPLFISMTHQHSKVRVACIKVSTLYVSVDVILWLRNEVFIVKPIAIGFLASQLTNKQWIFVMNSCVDLFYYVDYYEEMGGKH